jgi:hypothetical protein
MKKSLKKLSLSRETLYQLNERHLRWRGARPDVQGPPETFTTGEPVYTGPFDGGCPSYGGWCTFSCDGTC